MPPNRHVEFKKGGWGAAIVTVIATVAVFLTAFYIHTQTFREPTDVMMRQMGGDQGHGGGEGHAPAPAAGAAGRPDGRGRTAAGRHQGGALTG
jgi:hypothetical protein